MTIQFPSSFLWGAAISSYQCEGDNSNSDWCRWERERGLEEAAAACNHYYLFKKDFQLARRINLNSLRFSIEWARIQPSSFVFLEEEIIHYQSVIDSLLNYKLKPLVTLHHFTNPLWFADGGGWLEARNIDYFLAYLRRVVESLKDKVDTWFIFNEPLVYIYNGFIQGAWPPGKKSLKEAKKVLNNIIAAYLTGYEEIKRIYQGSPLSPQVSLAKHLRIFSGCNNINFIPNSFSAFLRNKYFNFWLLDYLHRRNSLDFIAVNYYCKEYTRGLAGLECGHNHKERKNYLDWNISPEGLYKILLKLKRFNLPVVITENGTAEAQSCFYKSYLIQHIRSVAEALKEGVDIRGYTWWSLLDNFEWDKGFGPRFGLVEVNYKNFERKLKPFAYTYAKICRENRIEI